ncbi:FHA domain-containing protein [bacterium]|nr:FHA domain-containing protein [bacterium]
MKSEQMVEPPPRQEVVLRPRQISEGLRSEYRISRFPATIGRHASNTVELTSDSISRYHARIEQAGAAFRLLDLRSSNGTFVNGRRVQVAEITDQDTVSFGTIEFSITIQSTSEPVPLGNHSDESTTSEVHFLQRGELEQTVFHAQSAEEHPEVPPLTEELTGRQDLIDARERLIGFYRLQEIVKLGGDESHLARGVLDLLFDALPADRGVFLIRDSQDALLFRPVAIKTRAGQGHERIGISRTILQRCLRERIALLTRDAGDDMRLKQSESVITSQMRSVMCVPLISANNVLGFCHLDTINAVRSFTHEDLAYLVNLCGEIAVHMHNLRMTRERIQSERMAAIGQTITGLAHNIKNILLLSQGGMELMEKRLASRQYEALEETWSIARRGLDRINSLVQDMLDYSRARQVERRKVDVNHLIDDLAESYAEELSKRRIEMRIDLDASVPPLMLDEQGLERAIVNLIVNAMEAAQDAGGWIRLATRINEGNLEIVIEDNGSGIPREIMPRLFIPFFTTKGSKGSGLGLAMTKKFVEDMGGRIDVRSDEGKGTAFTITLYVSQPLPRLGPPESESESEPESSAEAE